ncbi:two-component system sensor histidine kinase NtrB [Thermovenabulum sp.]|uniref:two-component system sensor histidine kinase NtrB n=1 Tax=Thermovenabulum sp. TaxID=3100335 RepID=UPI003C7BFE58
MNLDRPHKIIIKNKINETDYSTYIFNVTPYCLKMDERGKNFLIHIEEEDDISKNNFFSTLMHEVKNPITAIKGYLKLLELSLDETDGRRKFIYNSLQELERIEGLAKDILLIYKSINCNIQKINLKEVLEQIFDFYEAEMKNRKIDYTLCLSDKVNVMADRNLLNILFANLLLNAMDAVKEKGYIAVRSTTLENRILVEFEDNGEGMDEYTKSQLFTPFFTTKEKGTGLGLYLCKKIVENHGGVIYFNSEKGKGTVFYIELPCVNES